MSPISEYVASFLVFLTTTPSIAWGAVAGILIACIYKKNKEVQGLKRTQERTRQLDAELQQRLQQEQEEHDLRRFRRREKWENLRAQRIEEAYQRSLHRERVASGYFPQLRAQTQATRSHQSSSTPAALQGEAAPQGKVRYIPGFGSWTTTPAEELERVIVIRDRWEKVFILVHNKIVRKERAEAVDYIRIKFSSSGSRLQTSAWAKDNREQTRDKKVRTGRITKWTKRR
jgi:hypothetical protein